MLNRIVIWFRYRLEKLLLRGSVAFVFTLVCLLTVVALSGGALARALQPGDFTSYKQAVWWAILRLSDTGYLSDEVESWEIRVLSMMLSVIGMSVTVGGIVAIVSQVMNRTLSALASATTPVPYSNHTVILGWTDRTPELITHFLARNERPIVVLVDDLKRSSRDLAALGLSRSASERVVLRAGSPHRPHELGRAACARSKSVILAATARAIAGDSDEGPKLLKSVFALRVALKNAPPETPIVAVEVVDRALVPLVQSALPRARVLKSDRIVGRILRLSLQARGLIDWGVDLVTPDSGLRVESFAFDEFRGLSISDAERLVVGGRLMGALVRSPSGRARLITQANYVIGEKQRVLVCHEGGLEIQRGLPRLGLPPRTLVELGRPTLDVLILGWNEAAADLIAALALEPLGRYRVDVIARTPARDREQEVLSQAWPGRVQVQHKEGEPMSIEYMSVDLLNNYDRFVVLADRGVAPDAADVRTLAVAMALEQRRRDLKSGAYIVVELLEEANELILPELEVAVTPRIAADVMESLACTEDAESALGMALDHQATFVSRVVEVPDFLLAEEVGPAVRARGGALLELRETSGRRLAVFAEPVLPPDEGLIEILS